MMQGEPVNLREQQDAVEFFMRLIDLADEALKALGHEQNMTKVKDTKDKPFFTVIHVMTQSS